MNRILITERIEKIAEEATREAGLELVHVEMVGRGQKQTIRIFIDKSGGVTLEDCSVISRRVENVLDAEDFIPSAYLLEVSSPGIERQLYSIKDFEKFVGNNAKVKISEAINGQKNFRGKIVSVEDRNIVFEDITNGMINIPYNTVTKANLEIDFEEEFRKNL